MKILPNFEQKKEFILKSISNFKTLFGEDSINKIEDFKILKEKYNDILNYLLYSEITTKGGGIYNETVLRCGYLNAIIKVMEINNLNVIKGFNFSLEQINKAAAEINYF